MNDGYRDEDILRLLTCFPSKSLGGGIQDLYDAACEKRLEKPEGAIEHCEDALVILEKQTPGTLYPEELADTKGRFHVLLASVYLNEERNLKKAKEHFLRGRDAFHSRQWSHLESLACLGLAITQRKLKKLREAIAACESAQGGIEDKSIPSSVDVTPLREAIERERSEIQESLELLTRVPVVSDIAAGLGRIAEENVEEYLYLDDDEDKDVDFGVKVVGDSMKDDGILSGDTALIRQQPGVEMGEIAAVVIQTPTGSEGVLKRYHHAYEEQAGMWHWFLKSSNPLSEDLVVIPGTAKVDAIKALYDKASQEGKIRNPIKYYENAELAIAGKYVGLVRNG